MEGKVIFQSMRGNGFISTLLNIDENQTGITLWKNLWLNILENNVDNGLTLQDTFYWFKNFPGKRQVEKLDKIEADINVLKEKKTKDKSKDEKKQIIAKINQLGIERKKG